MDDVDESERTRSYIRYLLMMTEYQEAAKTVDSYEKNQEENYLSRLEQELKTGKKQINKQSVGSLEYEMAERVKNITDSDENEESNEGEIIMNNIDDRQAFYDSIAKERAQEKIERDEEQIKALSVDRSNKKIPSISFDVSKARKDKDVEEDSEIDNILSEVIFVDTLNGKKFARWDSDKLLKVLKNLPQDMQKELVKRMEERLYQLGFMDGDIK